VNLEQIEELAGLERAATGGEWSAVDRSSVWTDDESRRGLNALVADDIDEPDADFIAAARNALPELLAMARQLLRAREAALPVRVYLAADADVPRDHLCELLDALDGKAEK
jgi:hypothetical protein